MTTWTIMNIKGQDHSLNFVQGHSDSTFSIFLCSETARPIEAKFHMEPPLDVGNEFVQTFQVTWSCPYKLWWKTSKILFFGTKRPMTLKLGIQHRVLEHYQYFIWWPWVDLGYFYDRVKFVSECFCKGESLYSIECYCISKFVLILHILSTQVSDTGPMVLWFVIL